MGYFVNIMQLGVFTPSLLQSIYWKTKFRTLFVREYS